mgnify:CR=1 FL=1
MPLASHSEMEREWQQTDAQLKEYKGLNYQCAGRVQCRVANDPI